MGRQSRTNKEADQVQGPGREPGQPAAGSRPHLGSRRGPGSRPHHATWGSMAGGSGDRVAKVLVALGVLTDLDMTLFTVYCHHYHEYYDAQLKVTELGTMLVYARTGGMYQNPYVAIKRLALKEMKDLSARFGLSPADRARVLSGLESPEDDIDALGRWLFVNQPRTG